MCVFTEEQNDNVQSNRLFYTNAGEFRKLLAAFVSGSTAKSGGIIRKITPTSAELRDASTPNRSQQKLQVSPQRRRPARSHPADSAVW